jgi:UV DNA damage endonuclease
MRIGYPCINRSVSCTANSTLRLKNYSDGLCIEKARDNLFCLLEILKFNVKKGFKFFRIGSSLVPFASHPVCRIKWWKVLKSEFEQVAGFARNNAIRLSMHPDQFVVINSQKADVIKRSVAELIYHARVLDHLEAGPSARIQIHVGGAYGNKPKAIEKFLTEFKRLPKPVKDRLAIENDDKIFSLSDCIFINRQCGVPVIFDVFHHACHSNGEDVRFALDEAARTWYRKIGPLMVDFSVQKKGARKGTHAEHLNLKSLEKFFKTARGVDFDLMLEIKDKEISAEKALRLAKKMRM